VETAGVGAPPSISSISVWAHRWRRAFAGAYSGEFHQARACAGVGNCRCGLDLLRLRLALGVESLARGGAVISAGLSPATATYALNHSSLVGDEKSIRGSYMGSCVPERDVPSFIELYRQGRLPIDRLKSGTLRLEEINAGFDRLADVAAVRQIVTF